MNRVPTRRIFIGLAVATALGGLVTACGVKGPLYLPEEQETEEENGEDEEKSSRRLPVAQPVMHG